MKDLYLKDPEEVDENAVKILYNIQYEAIKRKIKDDII